VTFYKNPDLDGIVCASLYAEYLQKMALMQFPEVLEHLIEKLNL